jgi:AcrR family transcriptional regulator
MNMAARTTYHHGNLGPALIAVARELLDADGPGAVSLREAARRVGVSATATYRHFADKEHLLAAVAAQGYREFADSLRAIKVDGAGFSAMAKGYIEFALAHPGLFRLMFGPLQRERERFAELGEAARAAFDVLLAGARSHVGVEGEEAESLAYASWSFAHGLARLVLDDVIPRERALNLSNAFLLARSR